VLGEIGPTRDAAVAATLCDALGDPESAFRLRAIEAVGKLRVVQALPQLLERIKSGGEEAEASAQAAAPAGREGDARLAGSDASRRARECGR